MVSVLHSPILNSKYFEVHTCLDFAASQIRGVASEKKQITRSIQWRGAPKLLRKTNRYSRHAAWSSKRRRKKQLPSHCFCKAKKNTKTGEEKPSIIRWFRLSRVGGVFEYRLREKWGMIVFIQLEKSRPGGPSFLYSSRTMQCTPLNRWWALLTSSVFKKKNCVKLGCRKYGNEGKLTAMIQNVFIHSMACLIKLLFQTFLLSLQLLG